MNHQQDRPITYKTVVPTLFDRFPILRDKYDVELDNVGDEPPLPYVVFGTLVIPFLEGALLDHDAGLIASLCSFFEECAVDGRQDPTLTELLAIEIGEWLSRTTEEEQISLYLGPQTKRICRYVPGLATQRRKLKMEQRSSSVWRRLLTAFKQS